MQPILTIDTDDAPVLGAFSALPEAVRLRVLDACQVTAERAAGEMRRRLARQLSGESTGETLGGIEARRAYDGNGWIVWAVNDRMPNLPLWLEKGTRPGKRLNHARVAARKFFYVSLELEVGGHRDRVIDAMRESAADVGLGE